MTTQTELREQVSYGQIHHAVAAILPDARYQSVTQWRERWANDTMHAMGWHIADLMTRAGVETWDQDGYTIHLGTVGDRSHVMLDASGEIMAYGKFAYVGPRAYYADRYGNDQIDEELIEDWMLTEIAATLYPDMAGHCRDCGGPMYWDSPALDEDGQCGHCGALARVCESDCFDVGTYDVCQHHGSPVVPVNLWREHGEDHDAALAAYMADDPRARAVAVIASHPAGIWQFPGGKLDAEIDQSPATAG